MKVPLFVIVQQGSEPLYWTCSIDHGCRWSPGKPKQAFTPSELTKAIRMLINSDWFNDCEIRQLSVSDAVEQPHAMFCCEAENAKHGFQCPKYGLREAEE